MAEAGVEILCVGTELLLGQIVDTNSSWIGEQLALAGIDSHYQTKVGDNPSRIEEVLTLALRRSDAVICCGGLGPTQDDLSRDVIATVMGSELELDQAIADRIEAAPPQNADIVSARALAALTGLLPMIQRHMKPEGHALVHKGRQAAQEIADAQEFWSFTLEDHPSITDPDARLLDIQRILPRGT